MNEQIVNNELGHHFVHFELMNGPKMNDETSNSMNLLLWNFFTSHFAILPFANISDFWWIELNIIFTDFISRIKWIRNGWPTIWIINFGWKFGAFAMNHCVSTKTLNNSYCSVRPKYSHVSSKINHWIYLRILCSHLNWNSLSNRWPSFWLFHFQCYISHKNVKLMHTHTYTKTPSMKRPQHCSAVFFLYFYYQTTIHYTLYIVHSYRNIWTMHKCFNGRIGMQIPWTGFSMNGSSASDGQICSSFLLLPLIGRNASKNLAQIIYVQHRYIK